ncbi:C40 family peptidase [Marinibacterium profundimaris]|uniref:NlpC/P60 domain-containing protein n=1 Tax=Marinibacterium profundimaris TaxID=1679460 RepID=A0A225NNQ1_9RHOB|nr:C40 family peptidase [Marinibacterium profundimaris]OWU75919.1 hypothetical protein ATO3_06995 [Marinibacterium profundimaris]
MTDRRFWRANARIGHDSLEGQLTDRPLVPGVTRRIRVPVADLCASPGGKRDKQLLFGQAFVLLEERNGWAFGFDPADGYVGYLRGDVLHDAPEPTHRVTARSTHIYTLDDIKSPDRLQLSCFSELAVVDETEEFAELTTGGFVPAQHLARLSWQAEDPVAVAEAFLGTPYLWGGNSTLGIDCSGLVQFAFHAAGRSCPRDSDLQAKLWDDAGDDLRRGDLVFWKGHVALMLNATQMIHANAHHMAVAVEPFEEARTRIAKKEFGEILRIARP